MLKLYELNIRLVCGLKEWSAVLPQTIMILGLHGRRTNENLYSSGLCDSSVSTCPLQDESRSREGRGSGRSGAEGHGGVSTGPHRCQRALPFLPHLWKWWADTVDTKPLNPNFHSVYWIHKHPISCLFMPPTPSPPVYSIVIGCIKWLWGTQWAKIGVVVAY